MNKEEILQRAQKQKDDEYIRQVEASAYQFGMFVIYGLLIVATLYFWFFDYEASAIIFGFEMNIAGWLAFPLAVSYACYYAFRFYKLRSKRDGLIAIICIMGIIALIVRIINANF